MAKRLLNLTIVLLCVADVQGSQCVSPQYLELGEPGTIECDLQDSFYLLSWYDSTDYVNDHAVLYVVSPQTPRGKGYDSGEYDVTPKGSLVINNVSMQHEGNFSRTSLRSSESPQTVDIVRVIVIVPSDPPFPVIQADSRDYNRINLLQSEGPVNLECSVSDVHPRVELTWSVRTATGSRPIPAIHASHYEHGGLVTTRVNITTDLDKSFPLTLLTCTAAAAHEEVVRQNQSMVLVDNVSVYPSQAERTRKYIELNFRLDIKCTARNYRYLIWKKGAANPQTIAFSLFYEDNHFQEVLVDGYQLSNSDSLIIPNVGEQEEGFYWCTFSDDISWNSTLYDVIAFVTPSIPYPLVDHCRGKPDCAMRINGGEGTVTCNLIRIRPEVTLKWTTFYEDDSGLISFRTQSLRTRKDGPTFNVSLTSQFEVRDKQIQKLTIECRAYGDHGNLYPLSAKVKLLFVQDNTQEPSTLAPNVGDTERSSSEVVRSGSYPVGLYVITILIFILVLAILCKSYEIQLKRFFRNASSKIRDCWRVHSGKYKISNTGTTLELVESHPNDDNEIGNHDGDGSAEGQHEKVDEAMNGGHNDVNDSENRCNDDVNGSGNHHEDGVEEGHHDKVDDAKNRCHNEVNESANHYDDGLGEGHYEKVDEAMNGGHNDVNESENRRNDDVNGSGNHHEDGV